MEHRREDNVLLNNNVHVLPILRLRIARTLSSHINFLYSTPQAPIHVTPPKIIPPDWYSHSSFNTICQPASQPLQLYCNKGRRWRRTTKVKLKLWGRDEQQKERWMLVVNNLVQGRFVWVCHSHSGCAWCSSFGRITTICFTTPASQWYDPEKQKGNESCRRILANPSIVSSWLTVCTALRWGFPSLNAAAETNHLTQWSLRYGSSSRGVQFNWNFSFSTLRRRLQFN